MTYDFNVPGGPAAAPDTLFGHDPRDPNADDWTWNTTGTVANYLLHGVPASKIVVGVPFYGNQYINVSSTQQPRSVRHVRQHRPRPEQPASPTRRRSRPITTWSTWPAILTPDGKGANGYTAYWDLAAGEPYLASPAATHNLATGTVTTPTVISYSSPASIGERTRAHQGAAPARRDGLGDQPGLGLARADLGAEPAALTHHPFAARPFAARQLNKQHHLKARWPVGSHPRRPSLLFV